MNNVFLTDAFEFSKRKKYDAYYISVSNENLYEFTNINCNCVHKLTGFSGDIASLLLTKDKAYLYVDGRFTIQAKTEVIDKRISIIEVNKNKNKIDHIKKILTPKSILAINFKFESAKFVLKIKDNLKNIKVVDNSYFVRENIDNSGINDDIFVLSSKYITKSIKTKISSVKKVISDDGFDTYVTSNLEEIAYLTNLRRRPKNDLDERILISAFLIIEKNKSYIYVDTKFQDKIVKYLKNNNIFVRPYTDFYKELMQKVKKKYKVCIDFNINNYRIYSIIKKHSKNIKFNVSSPLKMIMSIKGEKEIKGLMKANILDGVAITKSIYAIKNLLKNNTNINEYDAKKIVDNYRKIIGKDDYISPSFNTIVAYKENSAICHYIPDDNNCKKLSNKNLLLIDSGGNYLYGTTDITRTISLYKNKKDIPNIIKNIIV